jgi:hypothetical protein
MSVNDSTRANVEPLIGTRVIFMAGTEVLCFSLSADDDYLYPALSLYHLLICIIHIL